MKFSTIAAVVLALCVVGILGALLLTGGSLQDLRGMPGYLCGGVLLFAAFIWNSELVDGWIRAAIGRLSFGGKSGDSTP